MRRSAGATLYIVQITLATCWATVGTAWGQPPVHESWANVNPTSKITYGPTCDSHVGPTKGQWLAQYWPNQKLLSGNYGPSSNTVLLSSIATRVHLPLTWLAHQHSIHCDPHPTSTGSRTWPEGDGSRARTSAPFDMTNWLPPPLCAASNVLDNEVCPWTEVAPTNSDTSGSRSRLLLSDRLTRQHIRVCILIVFFD